MVVVLDKNAIVFTRIWCGFEQATVVQGKKLLLDFATVHEGNARLLTEGVAASDERGASDWGRKVGKFDVLLISFIFLCAAVTLFGHFLVLTFERLVRKEKEKGKNTHKLSTYE